MIFPLRNLVQAEGNIGGVPEGDIVEVQPSICGACGESMRTCYGQGPFPPRLGRVTR